MSNYNININNVQCDQKTKDAAINDVISLQSYDDCSPSGNINYSGINANAGESYTIEYVDYARDSDENKYLIFFHFNTEKGNEPEDDCLPWDEDHIVKIEPY